MNYSSDNVTRRNSNEYKVHHIRQDVTQDSWRIVMRSFSNPESTKIPHLRFIRWCLLSDDFSEECANEPVFDNQSPALTFLSSDRMTHHTYRANLATLPFRKIWLRKGQACRLPLWYDVWNVVIGHPNFESAERVFAGKLSVGNPSTILELLVSLVF